MRWTKATWDRRSGGKAEAASLPGNVFLPQTRQRCGVADVHSFCLRERIRVADVAGNGAQTADAERGPCSVWKLRAVKMHFRGERHAARPQQRRQFGYRRPEYTRRSRENRGWAAPRAARRDLALTQNQGIRLGVAGHDRSPGGQPPQSESARRFPLPGERRAHSRRTG